MSSPSSAPTKGIPVVGPILNKLIGSRNERFVKRYTNRVAQISALEPEMRTLSDDQMRDKLHELRERKERGERPTDLLVEAFAVAREAMDRSVGIRNIFNPEHAGSFDVSALPQSAQKLYHETKERMDARPAIVPRTISQEAQQAGIPDGSIPDEDNQYLGCTGIIEGWQQEQIPVELYQAVREMYPKSKPPFRARPFDVQLVGGMVLYNGRIAEMKTGEGKTIVAPLATYLACVEGLRVHVVTVNDYLVQRDRDWVYPFFRALGLTVGAIHPMHTQPEPVKREMYKCDVVYGTTAEFGFDYLRDNMKQQKERQVQRGREFAIVDEVDSILIDEARTPLIISGQAHEEQPRYELADRLARHLVEKQRPWQRADDAVQDSIKRAKGLEGDIRNARDKSKVPELEKELEALKAKLPDLEAERDKHIQYYEVQLDRKQSHLTHDGIAEAQRVANVGSFYVGANTDLPHLLEQSVRAHVVYQRDKDYIVAKLPDPQTGRQEDSIVIVDANTGRPMVGRQWSDGLHQAVECKEAVPIKPETQTVATVTIQNYYKMYKRLAGMTGTADTEAQEFHDIYGLDVVSIPTNVQVVRRDFNDLMFLAAKDKWSFIVDEIKAFHDVGRPVLVGTTSVEKSELVAKMLSQKHQIKHEVLNAKQHEREASIVEHAGQLGAVMIATNMAGRGTDIKLGKCSREQLLDHWLKRGICSKGLSTDATTEQLRENVHRKIGPAQLGLPKREVEQMDAAELELALLRHWALESTLLSEKKINSMDPEELRAALDEHGRFILHRIDWFDSIEDMGGLHVIGTERHESRRIDNQLRGRSGRQGDKGSSRFFVGMDDDLMKMFAGDTLMRILPRIGMKEGDALEHPMLTKSVERSQRKVEERNFQIRKNILEYDEVMEHQRQRFYGIRQRVLDGRDVRGLLFEYVEDAVSEAAERMLGKDFAAQCASDYIRDQLEVEIFPDRLRGLEPEEMENRVRKEAKEEIRSNISVTLGEYIPARGSEVVVDVDAAGLARWAKEHFDVEIDPADIREQEHSETGVDRRAIEDTLYEAACEKIDNAPLERLSEFTEREYGPRELSKWVDKKFGLTIDHDRILKQLGDDEPGRVASMIMDEVSALYRKREIEYPVEFAFEMTMQMMRQDPDAAAQQLVTWANRRFGLDWTVETLRSKSPSAARDELVAESERFVEEQVLDKRIDEALAIDDREALAAYLKDTLDIEPDEELLRLEGEERDQAVRAKVESTLRAEQLFLERMLLLQTLDDQWKSHLYDMDQLRDSINYRAFSQKDPRIEYKREGSRLFTGMWDRVRDKVTDMLFKARVMPQVGQQQSNAQPPNQSRANTPRPSAQPANTPGYAQAVSMGTTGTSADMYPAPGTRESRTPDRPQPANGTSRAPSEVAAITNEAGQPTNTDADARQPAQVSANKDKVGRNDPCPCGSGKKYKKCCGAAGPHTDDNT